MSCVEAAQSLPCFARFGVDEVVAIHVTVINVRERVETGSTVVSFCRFVAPTAA